MSIAKYISGLLFQYDCVIVPDFGGFVTNYASATVHPVKHIFNPPSKNIVFNKNLKHNDGLLANQMVQEENIVYNQAIKTISIYVDDWNNQLKNGESIEIQDVGILYLDAEHNIQFDPDKHVNYLIDSFGLTILQSPLVKRDGSLKRIEKQFKDRAAISNRAKKINIKKYVALAIAMPLVFSMIWIPLKTDLLKNVNYSDLNLFAEKKTIEYKAPAEIKPSIIKVDIPKVEEKTTPPVIEVTESIEKAEYHIIGGCFKIAKNARRFVNKLKREGFNPIILDRTTNKLYRVSYNSYVNKEEALEEIKNLKSENREVWLLTK